MVLPVVLTYRKGLSESYRKVVHRWIQENLKIQILRNITTCVIYFLFSVLKIFLINIALNYVLKFLVSATGSQHDLRLESVDRLSSIPIIEHSLKRVENFYGKMKNSNCVLNWYIGSAENTFLSTYEAIQPVIKLIESPLKRLDAIMCKSLDVLEQRLPSVYLPPELVRTHIFYINQWNIWCVHCNLLDVLAYQGIYEWSSG